MFFRQKKTVFCVSFGLFQFAFEHISLSLCFSLSSTIPNGVECIEKEISCNFVVVIFGFALMPAEGMTVK